MFPSCLSVKGRFDADRDIRQILRGEGPVLEGGGGGPVHEEHLHLTIEEEESEESAEECEQVGQGTLEP